MAGTEAYFEAVIGLDQLQVRFEKLSKCNIPYKYCGTQTTAMDDPQPADPEPRSRRRFVEDVGEDVCLNIRPCQPYVLRKI